jgi:hypothetical protein
MSDDHRTTPGAGGAGHISGVGFAPFRNEAAKPSEFDRIRALLVRYAARLQDKNEEPPGQFLIAHAFLQAVEMLDLLAQAPEGSAAASTADMMIDSERALKGPAASLVGVERAALPPLRAREEKPACPESDSWFEAKIAEPKPIVAGGIPDSGDV